MADRWTEGVEAGQTDVSLAMSLRQTSNNLETTGVAHGSVTASYWRQGGLRTAISLNALAAVDSVHSDGGWKEVDSTNMPGIYRLDVPDAAFASGADWVVISIKVSASFVDSRWIPLSTAKTSLASILARLPTALVSGKIDASIGAMTTDVITDTALATSAVTEIVNALVAKVLPELTTGVPASQPALGDAIMLLYMALRNKLINTTSFSQIHNDAGNVICKSPLSEVASVSFTRDKLVTGP